LFVDKPIYREIYTLKTYYCENDKIGLKIYDDSGK